jgi:hypothetical protein
VRSGRSRPANGAIVRATPVNLMDSSEARWLVEHPMKRDQQDPGALPVWKAMDHSSTAVTGRYGPLAPDCQRLELRKMSGFIGHTQGTRAAEVPER